MSATRVRWDDTPLRDGTVLPAGAGWVVAQDNWGYLVRSDEIVSDSGLHRMVHFVSVEQE